MAKPYETFDFDLRFGKARENAFVNVMLRSRVEHKRDKKAGRTGNIAVEFEQRGADGIIRPSGIFASDSDRMAFEYAAECWLIVPSEYVRGLAKKAIRKGLAQWIGDGGNHHNALVPITWFVIPISVD